MRTLWRTVLVAPTLPVETMLWWLTLCWLATIIIIPDRSFAALHTATLLQVKGLWLWPALASAFLPPHLATIVGDRWRWLGYTVRLYKVAWWLFLALALLLLAPAIPAFWGPPASGVAASAWLLVRYVAGSPRPGQG